MATASTQTGAHDARATNRLRDHRAAWLWGSFVVAFLGGQIALGTVAVFLALGDPSFAVVPDYHEKAVHWDDSVKSQVASDRLGWNAETRLSETADLLGQRTLLVTLTDPQGNAIANATVKVRAFHHARAGEPVEATLRSHDDGHYSAAISMRRDGLWQVDLNATRGDAERFLLSETIDTQASES